MPSQVRPATKQPQARAPRFAVFLLVWAVGSTALGRSFTALTPDPRDAYLFAYIGLQWVHGRIPYLQVWDNKPPGIYAVNALVFSAFPKNFTALAVLEGIFILGCIATVYFLLRQWGAPRLVATLAGAAAAIACNLEEFNELGNLTEIYLLWPATLSMYCFTKSEGRFERGWIFTAGFFSGVASLFKTVGFAPLLAQSAFLIFLTASQQIRFRNAFRSIVINNAGALFAWVPFGVYFWKHHAFSEMVDATLIYPIKYGVANQVHLLSEPLIIASRLLPLSSLVVCGTAGLVWFLANKARLQASQRTELGRFYFLWPLVLFWLLFDLAGATAGGNNYPHYFLCLVPSLSVAAGLAYWFVVERIPPGASCAATMYLLFVLVLGPLVFSQAQDLLRIRNFWRHDQAGGWWDTIPTPVEVLGNELQSVVRYLNQVRSPGDTLFTWNYLPLLYFETGMRAPTRPVSAEPLRYFKESHDTFGNEILRDLKQSPPTFIVDGTKDPESSASLDQIYRDFYDFVKKGYELLYTVEDRGTGLVPGNLRVYRRLKVVDAR